MRNLAIVLIAFLSPSCDEDHGQWLPHKPTSWSVTPAGHARDAGPFDSVSQGWVTEAEISQYVDKGFAEFVKDFPEFVVPNVPVAINDDYVMYAPGAGWAGGMGYGPATPMIWVTLWSRIETASDPGPCFIKRSPDENYGTKYTVWRHTGKPLTPALTHELLHCVIDDPGHQRPEWSRVTIPAKGMKVTCSREAP